MSRYTDFLKETDCFDITGADLDWVKSYLVELESVLDDVVKVGRFRPELAAVIKRIQEIQEAAR